MSELPDQNNNSNNNNNNNNYTNTLPKIQAHTFQTEKLSTLILLTMSIGETNLTIRENSTKQLKKCDFGNYKDEV